MFKPRTAIHSLSLREFKRTLSRQSRKVFRALGQVVKAFLYTKPSEHLWSLLTLNLCSCLLSNIVSCAFHPLWPPHTLNSVPELKETSRLWIPLPYAVARNSRQYAGVIMGLFLLFFFCQELLFCTFCFPMSALAVLFIFVQFLIKLR